MPTIAIIGGGPAGLATAIELTKKNATFNVQLFDSPQKSETKFGESIPPASTPYLKSLFGKDYARNMKHHLPCPGSISVWGDEQPGYNDFLFQLEGSGFHLDRQHFEHQLRETAFSQGVKWHQGFKLSKLQKFENKVQLEFNTQSRFNHQLDADFIIDATGFSSQATRRMNVARNLLDEVIYLCVSLPIQNQSHLLPQTLIEATATGWWYVAKTPSDTCVITYCVDKSIYKKYALELSENWLSHLTQTRWLKFQIEETIKLLENHSPTIHRRVAPSSILSNVVGSNWLAIGDAASTYDPISSAGITKALVHANIAAQSISNYFTTNQQDSLLEYQKRVFDDFNQYCQLRYQLYRSEQRFRTSEFWKNRTHH